MLDVCSRSSTLIVIPARNEEATIGAVLKGIQAHGPFPILVVDDCSTDNTAIVARESGARVVSLPMCLGAWGAMQTGIFYAWRKGVARLVTMDADGQHEPEYLQQLIDHLDSSGADVVIGAFPARGSRARRFAWHFFRKLTGFSVADLTSGFRIYNRRAINLLAGKEATLLDYQDLGVLLLLRKAGLRIDETPVEMLPRRVGKSHIFSSWWIVFLYMAETTLLCLAHWRIRPVYADE